MSLSTKTDVPVKQSSSNIQSGPLDEQTNRDLQPFDLIGIGFGPANLSLSVRLAEEPIADNNTRLHHQPLKTPSDELHQPSPTLTRHLRTCFIDSNQRFRWHPGMMVSLASPIFFLSFRSPCPSSFLPPFFFLFPTGFWFSFRTLSQSY
jgi:hypothetical protein